MYWRVVLLLLTTPWTRNHHGGMAISYTLGDLPPLHAEVEQEIVEGGDLFPHSVTLDTEGKLKLLWKVDNPQEIITFRLHASIRTTDLLVFGFSDHGESSDADLVVMWTDITGNHLFQDTHTDEDGILEVDDNQDYNLDQIQVMSSKVVITFHRRFDTCDDDDYMIDSGTTHLLFYMSSRPLLTIRGLDVRKLSPGIQRTQLIKSLLPDPKLSSNVRQFTMHVDKVEVPAEETTYWCAVRKLPKMTRKHHIVKVEKAISAAGEGIVHHLEVFHCVEPPSENMTNYDAACGSMDDRPKGLEQCRQVIGAWAMGATGLTYPEQAGFPIGGRGFNKYVMLEIHYNNPQKLEGIVDSSGLKFYYTSELRQYDAGVMEVGLEYTDKLALPPHLPAWPLKGYCIEQCTQVTLPKGGIKVFAAQLHTHQTGRRTYTHHYRDGIQLPDLARDNHYSPHYQEIRKLPRQVTVLPGDSLVMMCEDRTTDKDNVTLGGYSISDEMCVNYMHYYPRVDLEVCKSSVTTQSLYGFFRFMKEYQGETTSPKLGISDNYKAIRWTPMNVELLKTFYETAPLSMQCNQSDGTRFPGNWENMPLPEVDFPLTPAERLCLL